MADVSQIKLPNGSVYDLIDEKSGYITAEYIENKTDYEIPVSRVGEIVVGETAIGTDSTNFPTSKAVVDYVDERVVQEMDAIDVGVISVNGKTGSVTLSASDVGAATISQIPTSTSQLTNDSGFITSYTDTKVEQAELSDSSNLNKSVLLSNDNNSGNTVTGKAYKHDELYYNPRYKQLTVENIQLGGWAQPGTITIGGVKLTSVAEGSSTITFPITTGTVALTSDIPTVPTKVSDLTNDSGFISSYTETDPVFSASAAAGITATDISNWNAKVSDDKTWNGITLSSGGISSTGVYIPAMVSTSATTAYKLLATPTPTAQKIVQYDDNAYLNSTTPSANDNSTKVATTAYVDAAIPDVSGFITSDSDTTYTLSNALSSHKFTSTLTAGGSGSGTSTATMEFIAGTGITLTDDTTNKKITIASTVVNTDEKLKVNSNNLTENTGYFPILTTATSTAETKIYNNQAIKVSYDGSKYTFTIGATSSQGVLKLFSGDSSSSHYTILQANSISATRTITLPNQTGTVALTSDIPQVYSSTNTSGYLTMATLPIYDGTVE